MVFDNNLLQEKLIEAWKLRSDDTSFSASLSPLIAECRSEEEFRTLFTKQILLHIDSATSSNLLQSYFKFHTRSGYINESIVIERLLCLIPSASFATDDVQIKFLIDLLSDTLRTMNVTANQASRLGKQINLLAKWLCSALDVYSSDNIDPNRKEILISVSNLFLLLFTNTMFYCLWLMTIKSLREQTDWRRLQEQVVHLNQRIIANDPNRPEAFEQILSKITRLHLSEDFHQEEIELNPSVFNPIVTMIVINQLHKSSTILLRILRFYEQVSTMANPSLLYLRFLQASFGGYVASISTNNSEYQHRWSAFIFFQLPRILASNFETHFDHVKQSMENFILHNDYLLNRMDELCIENVLEQILKTTLNYVKIEIKEKNAQKINQLLSYTQKIRSSYVAQIQNYYQTQTHSYAFQVLQSQRSLEQTLQRIFSSTNSTNAEENLQNLLNNITDYIPLICALDQYYPLIRLLLSYTETHFDLSIYLLCYLTSITDDHSEDFGILNFQHEEKSSNSYLIYTWLKKYWLSRHLGHALFSSSLESIDLLSNGHFSSTDSLKNDKEIFLNQIRHLNSEQTQTKYSNMENLSQTISLLGELPSLSLDETKETVQILIVYLTNVSYGSLIHVLLWLIANYQIANDDERLWIQTTIHSMGDTSDSSSIIYSLLDAIKRQLWSDFIDNPLASFYPILMSTSAVPTLNNYLTSMNQSPSSLIFTLSDIYLTTEFLDSEQSRALYVCSKYLQIDLVINRLLININTSNGIYETRRALFFIFGLILYRRRSSTRALLQKILPYLINMKSNEFMLEPNVYNMCLIMNILLVLDFSSENDQLGPLFRVKPWKIQSTTLDSILTDSKEISENQYEPIYGDRSISDAYHEFLDWTSNQLFITDNVRPVNYFLGWLQTILWMFSRTATPLKPFIKPKLIALLSEYLPLQFPIEKVLSIFDLSNSLELEYASMAISKDYGRLQPSNRMKTNYHHQQQIKSFNSNVSTGTITKYIYAIPQNL